MHGLGKVRDRTFKKFLDLQPHQKLKTRVTQAQWMMLRRFLYRWLEYTFRTWLQSVAKDHGRSTEGFIDSSDLLKCLPFTAASSITLYELSSRKVLWCIIGARRCTTGPFARTAGRPATSRPRERSSGAL